ncbi:MAG: inorganic phosphate transporter [Verrucomicrobiales bacterium]|jgi:PiT family inorganic phosphate transporter|nr:inorganic phosphate transporter [Verrucomicrobiales bacterium]
MLLILFVILVALVFEYINGFHDTANSIATVVATKVLTPRQAVFMAAVTNLAGALSGSAVASTIGKGLVDIQYVTPATVLCGLLGGIAWNLITWWKGLPSSSSHAIIGGLVGSTLGVSHGDWKVIKFFEDKSKIVSVLDPATGAMVERTVVEHGGLVPKVIVPMFTSPVIGLVLGFLVMGLLYFLLRKARPRFVNRFFGNAQLLSSCWMGFSHGLNDAQKTMGIIALSLVAATSAGAFTGLPDFLSFLRTPSPEAGKALEVAVWIKVVCALTMAAGTYAGGWRIIRTLGHKMVKLHAVHGFAAETSAATIIGLASHWGIPLSTTHVISSCIMGVGSAKSVRSVKWLVVERMVWAWVFTIPVTAGIGYGLVRLFGLG